MIVQQKSAFVNKKSRNQQKMLDDCADRTYNSPRSTKIEHQTEGGNTMAKAKRYTAEQLSDAEKMAATLANVPEEKRTLVIMMTNSFMAGMEAQKAIDDTAKAAEHQEREHPEHGLVGAQYTRMAAMKQTALQATAIRLPHTILREQTADRFFFNPMGNLSQTAGPSQA